MVLEDKDLEIIGAPIIKYGDSTVIVQHSETGLWLSYKVSVVTVKYSDNGAELNRLVVIFASREGTSRGCPSDQIWINF